MPNQSGHGQDVFSTTFGKSLICQLFPHVVSALHSIKGKLMSNIIMVSLLVSVMRDQVKQLKRAGFLATAIGISKECDDYDEKVRNGECKNCLWKSV